MKMFLEILLLIVLVIFLFFYFTGILSAPNHQQNLLGLVCFKGNCFDVELAKTSAQLEQGLMYRTVLDKNKGMLFIFDKEGIYPFWMKNTLIPLDIIWIDGNKKVVFISENAQPCKSLICPMIVPTEPAKYVLEVSAGMCKEIGLKLADELKINL